MPQAKLLSAEETTKGIKLTFLTQDDKIETGIYNNGNLNLNDIEKLIGNQIAFTNTNEIHITKSWNGKTPTYCDNEKHGFDR